MFCCGVCKLMFTGIHPEIVFTTPCGHLFHSQCIIKCLNRSSKCPFCTLFVKEKHLIRLYLQLDTNWKDVAASLKKKANTSIIDLDDSVADITKSDNTSIIDTDDSFDIPYI